MTPRKKDEDEKRDEDLAVDAGLVTGVPGAEVLPEEVTESEQKPPTSA